VVEDGGAFDHGSGEVNVATLCFVAAASENVAIIGHLNYFIIVLASAASGKWERRGI
jgi:hypothetical protein